MGHMWQKEKNDSSIVSLALLLALATTPMAATLLVSDSILAQSSNDVPSFPLPQTVPNGTTVRIDGSSGMITINQTLKQRFEKQFSGTTVEVAANGTDAALLALQDGKIDIAAIGRGLTPEEKANGLEQVRLRREKIAIAIGAENPFQGNLSDRQFAKIFRGEITDWSEVGGNAGKIRLIDRPASSETRNAFHGYPVFEKSKFATGATASQLAEDNAAEVVKQLGKDGIGYVLANQVSKLQGVRVVKMYNTLPDNPKYPFSQPLVYVYKKNPSPGVANFLGFATNSPGKQAQQEAIANEAEAIANAVSQIDATETASNVSTSPSVETTTTAIEAVANSTTTDTTTSVNDSTLTTSTTSNQTAVSPKSLWWLLLPGSVLGLVGFLLWWLQRKRSLNAETNNILESNPTPSLGEATSQEMPDISATPVTVATETTSDLEPEVTNASSNQNNAENLLPLTGAALAGGAGIAAGATLASKLSDSDYTAVTDNTMKDSNFAEKNPTDEVQPAADEVKTPSQVEMPSPDEAALDLEAPVTVVNTSYPSVSDLPQIQSDVELPSVEVANQVIEEVPQTTESNLLENISTAASAALAGGAAFVVGTVLGKQLSDKESDTEGSDRQSTPTNDIADVEAPTNEDKTSYPSLADAWQNKSNQQVLTNEVTPLSVEQPNISKVTSNVEAPLVEVTTSTSEVSEVPAVKLDAQPSVNSASELPEVSTVESDVEPAAFTVELPEVFTVESDVKPTADSISELPEVSAVAFEVESEESADLTLELPEVFAVESEEETVADSTSELQESPAVELEEEPVAASTFELLEVSAVESDEESAAVSTSQLQESPAVESDVEPAAFTLELPELSTIESEEEPAAVSTFELLEVSAVESDEESAAVSTSELQESPAVESNEESADFALELPEVFAVESEEEPVAVSTFELQESPAVESEEEPAAVSTFELLEVSAVESDKEPTLASTSQLPEVPEEALDLEAPVAVVNTSYPPLPDISQIPSSEDVEQPPVEMTQEEVPQTESNWLENLSTAAGATLAGGAALNSQLSNKESDTAANSETIPNSDITDAEAPLEVKASYPPLPDVWEDTSNQQATTTEVTTVSDVETSTTELPDVSEATLDLVADEAEPITEMTEEVPQPLSITTEDSTASISNPLEETTQLVDEAADSTIGLSATVNGIHENDELNVNPQTSNTEEVAPVADETTTESKDVEVEAENSIVLIPRTSKWAYVSWEIANASKEALRQQGGSQLALRLYDVTDIDLSYQTPVLVQQYECEETTDDRYVAIPASDRNYIAEIGYVTEDDRWLLLVRSGIARVFNRPEKDFWFIADAELIIHGATEPGANVTIGGHSIKLKQDGTFHLRIPFTDTLIDYVMTAMDADGKHAKTIRMHFSQETPQEDSDS